VSLGLLWFFAAHSLTATIVPLELVFEHRNYFASIGLFLALAGIMLLIPADLKWVRLVMPAGMVGLLTFTTALRAQEWSNPLRLAYAEAAEHPQSPRARYELGRLLVIASSYKSDSPFSSEAIRVLNEARLLPGSSILPESGLLLLANHTGMPVDPAWWKSMANKLNMRSPSIEDISALSSLLNCQLKEECRQAPQEMLTLFLAAMSHPTHSSRLLRTYSDFAIGILGDRELAERLLREAIEQSPDETIYRDALERLIQSAHSNGAAAISRVQLSRFIAHGPQTSANPRINKCELRRYLSNS
jgi:hypothetical protein